MAKTRLCTNEKIEVWNIDGDTIADVFTAAATILSNEYDEAYYSNLVTQQLEKIDGLEYNGCLYVHVW
jgi:hypothetical protein